MADPVSMGQQECLDLIRNLAVAMEGNVPCRCDKLHTMNNPKTASGHVNGCPVDEAVRYELASCGVV